MPKTPEQNQKIKDQRKDKISCAALRLFAVKGYDAVTIDEITNKSGCAHSLFYHYFDSKEAVLRELIDIASNNRFEFNPNLNSKLQIQELTEFFLKSMSSDSNSLYFTYMFLNLHFQKTVHMKKRRESLFKKLCDIVEKGQEEGYFEEGNPYEYVISYFSLIRGLAYARIQSKTLQKYIPSSKTIMNLFLKKGSINHD